jgi:hypothetical protein
MNEHIIGAYLPNQKINEEEVKFMKRINANPEREITDSNIAEKMSDLGIPYLDISEGPKTVRHTGPNGEIIDEVVSTSGEKGLSESWKIENIGREAIRHEYAREAKKFKESGAGPAQDLGTI